MAKYDPLAGHLEGRGNRISMSFGEIEHLVGFLPKSARENRRWWGNDRTHVQARAWLSAGYKVSEVDIPNERVVFSVLPRSR